MSKKEKNYKAKIDDIKENIKDTAEGLKEKTEDILKNVKDSSKKFEKKDIEDNKAFAALSYIIAPIPYFVNKKSKWVHYHAVEGMNLLIISIVLGIIASFLNTIILWPFWIIRTLIRTTVGAFTTILAIIGIVNVCNGKAKELPLINKFKIIKK